MKLTDITNENKQPGLWANIHAKRERIKAGSGERMRKPGSKGAPTADALRKSATEGLLDNPGEQDSPVAQSIIRRILLQRTDLLAKYGPEMVGQAVDEVADFVGDVEEIGSSDVSGWVKHVEQMLGEMGKEQGVAEGSDYSEELDLSKMSIDELKNHIKELADSASEFFGVERAYIRMDIDKAKQMLRRKMKQGVAESDNPEYDDEAGMADNNLETLERAVQGIDDLIQSGDNLPEWCQEKIAVAKSMLVAVWDYMESEEDSEEVDPEIDAMFEAMEQLAEELSVKHQVPVDTVWESLEQLDDHMLYETAAWRRKEGKSKSGGLNAKGVASYRRENPGSKLQTAVTTKPSKLKPGSKAAKRRKSFCARMSGVKGPMKKPNGKPTRKALALRKWNC